VIVALATVFYPAMPLLVAIVIGALVVGSALCWRGDGLVRLVLVGLAGTAAAVALHFPWLLGGLDNHDPDLTFAGRAADLGGYRLVDALRFDVGPLGAGWLTWGQLIAALLPLAIGSGWRLAGAVRAWTVAATCWLIVAAERADVLNVRLPPPEVLLAPAAAALALAVALGVVAFEVDLPGYDFGWRQLASLVAAAAIVVAALPVLAASFDGRWKMPRGGYDRTLRFQAQEAAQGPAFRVLWLGSPSVLPVAGWKLPPSVGQGTYATTIALPSARNLWSGPETGITELLPGALATARSGDTSRLGQLLAPMGVRYIVVADQLAPAPFGGLHQDADPALDDLLARQLDLQEIGVNPSIRVFRNTSWMPMAVDLGSQSSVRDPVALDPGQLGPALDDAAVTRYRGEVPGGTAIHLAEAFSPEWRLEGPGAAGESTSGGSGTPGPAHEASFGWANRFAVGAGGKVEVGYKVPGERVALALVQVALWLLVVLVAVRQPEAGPARGRRSSRRLPAPPGLAPGEGAARAGAPVVAAPRARARPGGTAASTADASRGPEAAGGADAGGADADGAVADGASPDDGGAKPGARPEDGAQPEDGERSDRATPVDDRPAPDHGPERADDREPEADLRGSQR
jgi:hypothetical protein